MFRDWKTTVAGLLLLVLAAAFLLGKITLEQFLTAVAVITGGGLALAKDAGNPPSDPERK